MRKTLESGDQAVAVLGRVDARGCRKHARRHRRTVSSTLQGLFTRFEPHGDHGSVPVPGHFSRSRCCRLARRSLVIGRSQNARWIPIACVGRSSQAGSQPPRAPQSTLSGRRCMVFFLVGALLSDDGLAATRASLPMTQLTHIARCSHRSSQEAKARRRIVCSPQ